MEREGKTMQPHLCSKMTTTGLKLSLTYMVHSLKGFLVLTSHLKIKVQNMLYCPHVDLCLSASQRTTPQNIWFYFYDQKKVF